MSMERKLDHEKFSYTDRCSAIVSNANFYMLLQDYSTTSKAWTGEMLQISQQYYNKYYGRFI